MGTSKISNFIRWPETALASFRETFGFVRTLDVLGLWAAGILLFLGLAVLTLGLWYRSGRFERRSQ